AREIPGPRAARPSSGPDRVVRGFLSSDGLPDERLELALSLHLPQDVAAADELSPDVDLGHGRPIRERLEGLPLLLVGHGVHILERYAEVLQDLDRHRGETALREIPRPLHIDDDRMAGHLRADFVLDRTRHVVQPPQEALVLRARACSAPPRTSRRGAWTMR